MQAEQHIAPAHEADKPFISDETILPEITVKGVALAIVLALVMTAANIYLGLQVGLIISASIPAAILSMGLFKLFGTGNILENNIVQTGASTGASVSAIAFTLPAMVIIGYWLDFSYWNSLAIILVGSLLGIFFCIPIRRSLLNEKELHYPEGRAISEVLIAGSGDARLKEMVLGGLFAAVIEFCQDGLHVISSSANFWMRTKDSLYGFGLGFSPTLIGAGYIIGFEVMLSQFIGAILSWGIGVPALVAYYGMPSNGAPFDMVMSLWNSKIRYIGVGVLLVAGLWSMLYLLNPIWQSVKLSLKSSGAGKTIMPRTDTDMPLVYVLLGFIITAIPMLLLVIWEIHALNIKLSMPNEIIMVIVLMLYLVIAGFVFSVVCGYFSGLVGMSASPLSAINLAAALLIAFIILILLHFQSGYVGNHDQVFSGAALAIIIATFISMMAGIANNNIQDLKTGQLVGATPWKQELMLLIGVVVSAFIAPVILSLLFNVYGIGGVFPHPGMDPAHALLAPQAALLAVVARGVFSHDLPWNMIGIGAGYAILMLILSAILKRRGIKFSVLAMGLGIYLPLAVTTPLFIGGLISLFVGRHLKSEKKFYGETDENIEKRGRNAILCACGLIAGGSIMGVILAIPFAIFHSTDALSVVGQNFTTIANVLGIIFTVFICAFLYKTTDQK